MPTCSSRRVRALLTVEVGRPMSLAAPLRVPALAAATNAVTSFRSGALPMSNTTLRKLHQQKKPGHRRRLFILQEIQNLLQITLTSVPWIPTDSEKPAHLLWRVGCITGRFASAQIDEFRNSLVPRS